ncbi:MAG: hypothetical protein ACK5MY_02670 [Jhaorihella sp.]
MVMSDGATQAKRHENVGPYMYTRGDFTRSDGYRIVLYGAFNAQGLIGCEYNGVAVLDNNRMEVWCDNIGQTVRGWCYDKEEPGKATVALFEWMKTLSTEEFVEFVNTNRPDRCRYHV